MQSTLDMQYRKKPVIIEAVQFTGKNQSEIKKFTDGQAVTVPMSKSLEPAMIIPTLEGDHRADKGDFIIKGVKGEFYPCKPEIFEETYESAAF